MLSYRNLMTVAAVAALGISLAACSSSSSDDPDPVEETPPAEETMAPEPEPATPSDLETTQEAAADAAAAAKTASDAADMAADDAEEDTANIATLQTGEMAKAYAMAARTAASMAMDAADTAMDAADAAAAATTALAAPAADADAEDAQADAEAAQADAEDAAMKASEAAMTELHIDGTMKNVGDSSVDANMGELIDREDGEITMRTGRVAVVNRAVAAIPGRAFDDNEDGDATPLDPSDDVTYRQAVAAQTFAIGKVLDTTDDMARLTLVTGRAGTTMVRVFADGPASDDPGASGVTAVDDDGMVDISSGQDGSALVVLRSIGMFHEAMTDATPPTGTTPVADALDFTDEIPVDSEAVEVFSYTSGDPATTTYVVVESRTRNSDGDVTSMSLRAVDVEAAAAVPDTVADADTDADMARVMAALPSLEEYSHIHFGVWANLVDNEDGDNARIGSLGIGFVQNYDDSGITTGHVTGTATYSGDWVAIVRPSHSSALASENGSATLTANFSEDEFTGELMGLATLEGELSGNTFSGTDAMVEHERMDEDGTFAGSFSGAIYGEDGAEAAGVFSFDGGDAGAFVGAFGGRDDNQ